MSGKISKAHPLNGVHTAGIFADMSVDGPEIGTLVLIVDRAKNLPNRKTIGKQDPYCAARLGKEAQRTKTDIRGGQTPRWDQELRFKVHDSPDYYQLKLSVFHDDKKTDLIGETWIDLKDIIVPGGNQNDMWQHLACRGKYAGEVRVELTYYDTRPKPEKPAPKPKPVETDLPAKSAQQQQRSAVKRRPLPSDPSRGEDPPQPKETTGPRDPPRARPKQPTTYIPTQSPLQAVEYGTPAPQHQPEEYVPAPQPPPPAPRVYTDPLPHQHETPPPPPRRYTEQQYDDQPRHFDDRNYTPNYPSQPPFDHQETRSQYTSAPEHYLPPPPVHDQRFELPPDDEKPPPPPVHRSRTNSSHEVMVRGGFDANGVKGTPPMRHDVLRNEAHRNSVSSHQGRPVYRAYEAGSPSSHEAAGSGYEPSRPRHQSYDSAYDPHHRTLQPTVEDAPESPSPVVAHGLRHADSRVSQQSQYDNVGYDNGAAPPPLNLSGRGSAASGRYSHSPTPSQHSPLEQHGYAPAPSAVSSSSADRSSLYHQAQHSADFADHFNDYRSSGQVSSALNTSSYREPSPLAAPQDYGSGGAGYNAGQQESVEQEPREEDMSTALALVPRKAYASGQYNSQYHAEADDMQLTRSSTYALPAVPPSLVPGVDPALAREVADRIYEEQRNERRQRTQSIATPPRGRDWSERSSNEYINGASPAPYTPHSQGYANGNSPGPYTQQSQGYDHRSNAGASNPHTPSTRSRGISASPSPIPEPSINPSHTIKRKSISPAPPPAERRRSAVPFGPDDYDSLNPSFTASHSDLSQSEYADPDAKIITHDGREIDPSDHLPIESWAPEPEPREKRGLGGADDRNQASLRGGAPPSTGRRQLRIAARPHSMAPSPSGGGYMADEQHTSPASTGRNRLQKKANRMSALPAPPSTSPSPLAPIPAQNYNGDGGGREFAPQRVSRASTWDYPSENHAPQYGTSPGGGSRVGAPAIPPKVPIPTMSGALVTTRGGGHGGAGHGDGEDWALMEEMKRIDIGSGRSRRHGGY